MAVTTPIPTITRPTSRPGPESPSDCKESFRRAGKEPGADVGMTCRPRGRRRQDQCCHAMIRCVPRIVDTSAARKAQVADTLDLAKIAG
jgi:hypothetical protein